VVPVTAWRPGLAAPAAPAAHATQLVPVHGVVARKAWTPGASRPRRPPPARHGAARQWARTRRPPPRGARKACLAEAVL